MNLLSTVALCSLLACAGCQEPQKQSPPVDAQKVLDEVMQQFAKEGITIDVKAETVAVPAVVNQPQDPCEYLLIHRKGKRHEALFVTRCKPSVLNAALLMLGLTPGKNAIYVEKNPAPTLEEVQKGADPLIVTPPSGTPLWLTVRWTTPEGKKVEHCVEDVIMDLSTQKAVVDARWVFLGGRMARLYKNDPEVYVADMEGNLISCCYMSPDNHLATMAHGNARDDQNWWMTNVMPPVDTEVEFVFHKQETRLHKERVQRLAKEAAEAKAAPKTEDGKEAKTGGK